MKNVGIVLLSIGIVVLLVGTGMYFLSTKRIKEVVSPMIVTTSFYESRGFLGGLHYHVGIQLTPERTTVANTKYVVVVATSLTSMTYNVKWSELDIGITKATTITHSVSKDVYTAIVLQPQVTISIFKVVPTHPVMLFIIGGLILLFGAVGLVLGIREELEEGYSVASSMPYYSRKKAVREDPVSVVVGSDETFGVHKTTPRVLITPPPKSVTQEFVVEKTDVFPQEFIRGRTIVPSPSYFKKPVTRLRSLSIGSHEREHFLHEAVVGYFKIMYPGVTHQEDRSLRGSGSRRRPDVLCVSKVEGCKPEWYYCEVKDMKDGRSTADVDRGVFQIVTYRDLTLIPSVVGDSLRIKCFLGLSLELYENVTAEKLREVHYTAGRDNVGILIVKDDGQCCLESEYENRRSA